MTDATTPTIEPTEPATPPLSEAFRAALQAVHSAPGSSAMQVAEAAGIGKSTAAKALPDLERLGLVTRTVGKPVGNRRPTHHWHPAEASGTPEPDQPTAAHTDVNGEATEEVPAASDSIRPEKAPDAESEAVASASDDSAPPTGTPDPAPTDPETSTESASIPSGETTSLPPEETPPAGPIENPAEPPGPEPVEATDTDTGNPAATPASGGTAVTVCPACGRGPERPRRTTSPTGLRAASTRPRLQAGALRQKVADHLATHPTEEFTATALGRILDRSSGAVANALATMVTHGTAEQTNDRPRTYRHHTPEELD